MDIILKNTFLFVYFLSSDPKHFVIDHRQPRLFSKLLELIFTWLTRANFVWKVFFAPIHESENLLEFFVCLFVIVKFLFSWKQFAEKLEQKFCGKEKKNYHLRYCSLFVCTSRHRKFGMCSEVGSGFQASVLTAKKVAPMRPCVTSPLPKVISGV